jgi:hypothetical protein
MDADEKIPSSKFQVSKTGTLFWNLRFGIRSEFGIWNLELGTSFKLLR